MTSLPPLLLAVVRLATWGYEVDPGGWPGLFRTEIEMVAVAADGTACTATWTTSRDAEAFDFRILITDFLEEDGFVVVRGPGETFRVYGPGGQPMRSLSLASEAWAPFYQRAPWVPELKNVPKPKK